MDSTNHELKLFVEKIHTILFLKNSISLEQLRIITVYKHLYSDYSRNKCRVRIYMGSVQLLFHFVFMYVFIYLFIL